MRLTKQAAARRRIHKLASVARIVKYNRAMEKMAGMPSWAAQQMNMASPGVGDAVVRRSGGMTSDGSFYGSFGPGFDRMFDASGSTPKQKAPTAKPKGRNLLKKKSGGYKCARTWAEWARQKMMGSVGQNPVTAPPQQNQSAPPVPNSSKYNRAGSFPRAIPTKPFPQPPVTGQVSQR